MIRVAFTLIGGSNWTGGRNYLLNLCRVLCAERSAGVTPLLFADQVAAAADLEPFAQIPGLEVIRSRALDRRRVRRLRLLGALWGRDPALLRDFSFHRVDVVFESAQFFGWRLGIPALAWLPDFQHRALPHMFTRAALLKRELGFRAQVMAGRTIMLSSEDAKRDCERHYPATRGHTAAVRFAVPSAAGLDEAAARRIADAHGLPELFYFLPNQFWQHKNHGLVVRAMQLLQARGTPVVVAVSGKPHDPRNPGYFQELMSSIERAGVSHQFRMLGLLPHEHVAALMLSCVAVLNPSRFEGWSTTVEEARSLGTPMLLSDLAVHREQMGDAAQYFGADDPIGLADLLQHFAPLTLAQRRDSRAAGRVDAENRVRRFAADFAMVVRQCLERQPGNPVRIKA